MDDWPEPSNTELGGGKADASEVLRRIDEYLSNERAAAISKRAADASVALDMLSAELKILAHDLRSLENDA